MFGHPDTKARSPTSNRLFPVPPEREAEYGCADHAWYLKNG